MSYGGSVINVGGIYADLDLNSGNLERGLAAARVAMSAAKAELKHLQDDLKAGAISAGDAASRIAVLNQTINDLTVKMNAAYAAVGVTNGGLNLLGSTAGKTSAQLQGLSQTMLALGRGAQDYAQAGFMGIVNNFEQLGMGIGRLAGMAPAQASIVAAALQAMATAAFVLWKNWDELMDYFDVGIPVPATDGLSELERHLKKLNDEIRELTKDQKRVTITEERIIKEKTAERDETKRKADEEKDLKSLTEGMTPEESDTAAAFKNSVRGAGPGQTALEQLTEAIRQQADESGQIFNPFTGNMTSYQQYAKDLMRMAGKEGNAQAYNAVQQMLSESYGGPAGSTFGQQLFSNAPDVEDARKEIDRSLAEKDAERQRDAERPDNRFEEEAKKRSAENKLAKQLADKEAHRNDPDAVDHFEEMARAQSRKNKQRVEDMARNAEEQEPGLKEQIEAARLREMVGQANGVKGEKSVQDRVKEALIAQGYKEDDANAVAKNLLTDADKSIGSKVARSEGMDEDQPRRKSEVFDTADIAHKVQSAVGGENFEKKAQDDRQTMIKYLAEIAKNGPGLVWGGAPR